MQNDSFFNQLNENQRKAVTHTDGALLILAGAGSGKTKTLTHRIAYLIKQGIPPHSILAITFTNKAAEEMRGRIFQILQNLELRTLNIASSSLMPFIGTFHSFCNRILRNEAKKLGFTEYFTIFDEDDSLSLIKEIQKDFNINPKQFPAGVIADMISALMIESAVNQH
jgi:DNA helicase-2/ATP-dependent DNA helicase PcrA